MQVQEAFYSYDRSYQILAVGTHTKSARDLEICIACSIARILLP
ncbi:MULTISPECIES: hypothetical protein [Nostocales]|uniref:Uncharacterized protein n=2 Tax=Nostocales TaxID=1161 RepID=A0ABW8WUB5_9CYAN|nr:hypothetical protein [Tolypothrix bouteillei]